jgi:histidyl-tRNA synthetase
LYQAPRGTSDILPEEQAYWRHVEEKAILVCQLHGYQRIDTPVFEDTHLFLRGVGEETEIVTKQMYTFEDKGGSQLTLRPEGTAPVCRAYLEHGMHNLPPPVKLYYIAPIFRYERPQAGRYRQHHQFGCETIGDDDPALDAEVIDMAWQFFLSLNIKHILLKLNSIGCKRCRPKYLNALVAYYSRYENELCQDCKIRLKVNPLRLLDCKKTTCQKIADSTPRSIDYLCSECSAHFERLNNYLKILDINVILDHHLVRGLDYYTKTVFEIQPEAEGGQSALGGGGRYDNLIEELGGKPTPAIGFATGIERIIRNIKEQCIAIPSLARPEVYLAYTGDEVKEKVVQLASALRKSGIALVEAVATKSLKAQLRQANNIGVKYTVIVGDEELKKDAVILRNMVKAEQKIVSLSELPDILQ